uniref:Uncharacterized protein n=1 Tax=viral metagenome TaxID=1070528 RepID=A0A6C0J9W8_9ZZZZ
MVKKISNDTLIDRSMVKLPIFDEKSLSKQGELFYDLKTDSLVIRIGEGWKFFPTTTEVKLAESAEDSLFSPLISGKIGNFSPTAPGKIGDFSPLSSAPPSYESSSTLYPNLSEDTTQATTVHKHEHIIRFSSLLTAEPNFRDIENKIIELNNKLSEHPNIKKIKLKNDFSFFEFLKNRFKNVKISPSGDIKFDIVKNKYLD